MTSPNPFEVLRLPPEATEDEIVRQAERLRQRATDDEMLGAIRQAARTLTSSSAERALHALRTHPRPGYSMPTLDRLVAAFRRLPDQPPMPCPALDEGEFLVLLLVAAAEELTIDPQAFEPLDLPDDAEELQRQMSEALFQSLLCDMRG